jgi:hypothetical protein
MKPVITHQDSNFYENNGHTPIWLRRRQVMAAFMVLSDFLCLSGSMGLVVLFWSQVRAELLVDTYQSLILPVAGLFLCIYLLTGLYPGIGVGPVEELRRLTIGTSLGTLGLMGLSFYLRNVTSWSRAVIGLTWLCLLVSAPLMRKVFRRLAVKLGLWGMPAVIIGESDGAEHIYASLRQNRLIGLWPVLCVKTGSLKWVFPSPSEKKPDEWEGKSLFKGIDIAIIVPQKAPLGAIKNVLLDRTHRFQRVIVIFDEGRIGSVWFTPLHLVEHLGLEVTHQLINPAQQFIKRLIDITLILVSLPILLPLVALIAIAIKLDSPGPVFYTQKRVGHNGKEIRIWKFRSMVLNAEYVLNDFLAINPALRLEWERSFKLKHDPRVTRVGRILRRASLDELPDWSAPVTRKRNPGLWRRF